MPSRTGSSCAIRASARSRRVRARSPAESPCTVSAARRRSIRWNRRWDTTRASGTRLKLRPRIAGSRWATSSTMGSCGGRSRRESSQPPRATARGSANALLRLRVKTGVAEGALVVRHGHAELHLLAICPSGGAVELLALLLLDALGAGDDHQLVALARDAYLDRLLERRVVDGLGVVTAAGEEQRDHAARRKRHPVAHARLLSGRLAISSQGNA